MKRLFGVTVAMVTPFMQDGTIDIRALELLTEFLISKKVNCLYPCGTTGEMLKMKEEERKLAAETVTSPA